MAQWMPTPYREDVAFGQVLSASIDKRLLADDEFRAADHANAVMPWPRGSLSASRLAWPLQWQALKTLGCPQRVVDNYARRLFLRGRQCEDWLVEELRCTFGNANIVEQKPAIYRETVGFIDVLCTPNDSTQCRVIEIKSTANAKFRRIIQQGPDRSHMLQAGLYALAVGAPEAMVLYVAADDYRTLPFVIKTADIKPDIDRIIDRYQEWKLTHTPNSPCVPLFVYEEKWQANLKYNSYPAWSDLSDEDCALKYQLEHKEWKL